MQILNKGLKTNTYTRLGLDVWPYQLRKLGKLSYMFIVSADGTGRGVLVVRGCCIYVIFWGAVYSAVTTVLKWDYSNIHSLND